MGASIMSSYDPGAFYCEMLRDPANQPVRDRLAGLSVQELKQRAAAAAAKMLGLDREATRRAISIGATQAGGLRENFGTMTKPLHAGRAAESGVGRPRW